MSPFARVGIPRPHSKRVGADQRGGNPRQRRCSHRQSCGKRIAKGGRVRPNYQGRRFQARRAYSNASPSRLVVVLRIETALTPCQSFVGGCKLLFIQPMTIGDVSGSSGYSFDEQDLWFAVSHARTLMRRRSPRREYNCRHPRTSMTHLYCSGAPRRPTGAHLRERPAANLEREIAARAIVRKGSCGNR